jgi:Winged helix-turn helix
MTDELIERADEVLNRAASPMDLLTGLINDRDAPQKHVSRARIILLSADGVGTVEIMRRTGKSKTCVWRWQERFAEEALEGLLRDKTRPPRIAPLGPEAYFQVTDLFHCPHGASEPESQTAKAGKRVQVGTNRQISSTGCP